jgi:hypothetical protein
MTTALIIELIGLAIGSGGIGAFIMFLIKRHDDKKGIEALTKQNTEEIKLMQEELAAVKSMSLGALYDRAKFLGESYLKRGWWTLDEYEDYKKYLFQPYHAAGGDGTIDKIMIELEKMPIEAHAKG